MNHNPLHQELNRLRQLEMLAMAEKYRLLAKPNRSILNSLGRQLVNLGNKLQSAAETRRYAPDIEWSVERT